MSKPYKPREAKLSRLRDHIDGLLSSDYNQNTASLVKIRLIIEEEDFTVINEELLDACVKEAGDIYNLTRQDKNAKDEPRDENKYNVSMDAASAYGTLVDWESRCK